MENKDKKLYDVAVYAEGVEYVRVWAKDEEEAKDMAMEQADDFRADWSIDSVREMEKTAYVISFTRSGKSFKFDYIDYVKPDESKAQDLVLQWIFNTDIETVSDISVARK